MTIWRDITKKSSIQQKGTFKLYLKVHHYEHMVEELLKEEQTPIEVTREAIPEPKEDNNK